MSAVRENYASTYKLCPRLKSLQANIESRRCMKGLHIQWNPSRSNLDQRKVSILVVLMDSGEEIKWCLHFTVVFIERFHCMQHIH